MGRESSIVDVDLNRRRYLMQRVMNRVQGYQMLWMSAGDRWDSPYLKGRYLAAKDFYDWLADGGKISDAKSFLAQMKVKADEESEKWDAFKFASDLTAQVERVRPKQQRHRELMDRRDSLTPEETRELAVLHMDLRCSFTEEEIEKGYRHVYAPGFTVSREEGDRLKALADQHGAGNVEAHHLERLLNDPFVKGEIDAPPPPPPRAVIDETEYEDENDEPD